MVQSAWIETDESIKKWLSSICFQVNKELFVPIGIHQSQVASKFTSFKWPAYERLIKKDSRRVSPFPKLSTMLVGGGGG